MRNQSSWNQLGGQWYCNFQSLEFLYISYEQQSLRILRFLWILAQQCQNEWWFFVYFHFHFSKLRQWCYYVGRVLEQSNSRSKLHHELHNQLASKYLAASHSELIQNSIVMAILALPLMLHMSFLQKPKMPSLWERWLIS